MKFQGLCLDTVVHLTADDPHKTAIKALQLSRRCSRRLRLQLGHAPGRRVAGTGSAQPSLRGRPALCPADHLPRNARPGLLDRRSGPPQSMPSTQSPWAESVPSTHRRPHGLWIYFFPNLTFIKRT